MNLLAHAKDALARHPVATFLLVGIAATAVIVATKGQFAEEHPTSN